MRRPPLGPSRARHLSGVAAKRLRWLAVVARADARAPVGPAMVAPWHPPYTCPTHTADTPRCERLPDLSPLSECAELSHVDVSECSELDCLAALSDCPSLHRLDVRSSPRLASLRALLAPGRPAAAALCHLDLSRCGALSRAEAGDAVPVHVRRRDRPVAAVVCGVAVLPLAAWLRRRDRPVAAERLPRARCAQPLALLQRRPDRRAARDAAVGVAGPFGVRARVGPITACQLPAAVEPFAFKLRRSVGPVAAAGVRAAVRCVAGRVPRVEGEPARAGVPAGSFDSFGEVGAGADAAAAGARGRRVTVRPLPSTLAPGHLSLDPRPSPLGPQTRRIPGPSNLTLRPTPQDRTSPSAADVTVPVNFPVADLLVHVVLVRSFTGGRIRIRALHNKAAAGERGGVSRAQLARRCAGCEQPPPVRQQRPHPRDRASILLQHPSGQPPPTHTHTLPPPLGAMALTSAQRSVRPASTQQRHRRGSEHRRGAESADGAQITNGAFQPPDPVLGAGDQRVGVEADNQEESEGTIPRVAARVAASTWCACCPRRQSGPVCTCHANSRALRSLSGSSYPSLPDGVLWQGSTSHWHCSQKRTNEQHVSVPMTRILRVARLGVAVPCQSRRTKLGTMQLHLLGSVRYGCGYVHKHQTPHVLSTTCWPNIQTL
eukprot:308996-Chlamydomonas_euryale.AAC.2